MRKISLNGKWNGLGLSAEGKKLEFEGLVPGCVHTDMMKAGVIGDPFWRLNGDKVQWIEQYIWRYEREFFTEKDDRCAFLEFDGLDVYCEVFLNDVHIGRGRDMFVRYRFPTKGALKKGRNKVTVVFYPAVFLTEALPKRECAFTAERLYTRREQCTYYWDWANRFVTCGIYREVALCYPQLVDVESIYVYTNSVDPYSAQITYEVALSIRDSCPVRIEIFSPCQERIYQRDVCCVEPELTDTVDVPKPSLWNVNGAGGQEQYTLCVTTEYEHVRQPFGIRTVKLLQLPDPPGSEFYQKCLEIKRGDHVSGQNDFWDRNESFEGFLLMVNGEPVMCKGANWVPCEPFASAERPEKIRELLTLAKEAGVNMLRVWGGGIVEQDFFYQECDRLGIAVTQDFMMACGNYPEEDEEFLHQLEEEAKCAALRLRSHPCLVWWTGDNENAMDADEGIVSYKGRRAALGAIGPVLKQYDPARRFLPSSPYKGIPYGSITKGTTHNSNFIGGLFSYIRREELDDYTKYLEGYLSRFCAEQPTMGVPSYVSLKKFMTEDDIFNHNQEVWRYHTKNNPAEIFREFEIYDYLMEIAQKLFGHYQNGADRLFKMQYVQYEWVRIYMELYRRNKWFSSGLLYWMWNDNWPASGWSLVDYYGLPKAAYYAFKKTAKPVIASIGEEKGCYEVYVCNDSLKPTHGSGRLWTERLSEESRQELGVFEFTLPANSSQAVFRREKEATTLGQDYLLMCEIKTDQGSDRSFRFECSPKEKHFPETKVRIVEQREDFLILETEGYVHAVMLEGEYVFEDNCFQMLAGERRRIGFRRSFESSGGEIRLSWLGKEDTDVSTDRTGVEL